MLHDGFPTDLKDEVNAVVEKILHTPNQNMMSAVSEEKVQYIQNNKSIQFPYRIYYKDVSGDVLNNLSEQQQMILHCIYSRSSDGIKRQNHLQALLKMDYEDWAIPYIVKVCDEYVVEILEMIYEKLNGQNTERIKSFCYENKESFCKSYNRMISYWNEFYRSQHPHFKNYIGRKLFRECFGHSRLVEREAKIKNQLPTI